MNALAYDLDFDEELIGDKVRRRDRSQGTGSVRTSRLPDDAAYLRVGTTSSRDDVGVTRLRDHTIARLRAISQYRAGWDGEAGLAPRREAIRDAIDLVAHLTREVEFQAAPEPDGAVHLTLHTDRGRAILVLEGNHRVNVYVCRGGGDYDDPIELNVPSRIGADQEVLKIIAPILAAR